MPYNGSAHNLQTSPAGPLRGTASLRQITQAALSVRFSYGVCAAETAPNSTNGLSGSGACYTADGATGLLITLSPQGLRAEVGNLAPNEIYPRIAIARFPVRTEYDKVKVVVEAAR